MPHMGRVTTWVSTPQGSTMPLKISLSTLPLKGIISTSPFSPVICTVGPLDSILISNTGFLFMGYALLNRIAMY